MVGLMALPALIATMSVPEKKTVEVIDNSGLIAGNLKSDNLTEFVIADQPVDSLKNNPDVGAILIIGKNIIDNPNDATLLYHGTPSMILEAQIANQLSSSIEDLRLKKYNIENLAKIIEEVKADVSLTTIRIDGDDDTETSSMMSFAIGLGMAFLLYFFILMYGQMVMNSIIEEKSSRVLEIVVSSVNPQSLMLGKILGVGLVALTQILIWCGIIAFFSAFVLPSVIGGASTAATGAELDSMVAAILQISDLSFLLPLLGWLVLFMVGGYLFYSSIFAAIGSSVDNIQDASQLTFLPTIPIILGFIFAPTVVQDPDSTLAFWTSVIPFTSPMVMMARIPFGIPVWQIILSVVALYASFMFMIWLAAKIYRVGIFMHGKKPSVRDLIRWMNYK